MSRLHCLLFLAALYCPSAFAGQSDEITNLSFEYQADAPDKVLEATSANLKAVFQRYKPLFDNATTVVRPLRVTGTATNPVVQLSVNKCVLFICATVDLDATMTIREVSGRCARNFLLEGDLKRSSSLLSSNYETLQVNICYGALGQQKAKIGIHAVAVRASSYFGSPVSSQAFSILSMQVAPMAQALRASLKANGAR